MATDENRPVVDFLDPDDPFWSTDHPMSDAYKAKLERERKATEEAVEHAFVICQREMNFCLNNDIAPRAIFIGDLLLSCTNWLSGYTYASEGFGLEISDEEGADHAIELLSVFAPVYLRYLIASLFDSTTGIIEHLSMSVPSDVTAVTEEQEAMIYDMVELFESPQKPTDEACLELGSLVARHFAWLVSEGMSDDELVRDVARLDDEGLPVYATIGMAAALGACVGREPYEDDCVYQPYDDAPVVYVGGLNALPLTKGKDIADAFYAVLDGTSNRDVAKPSLTTPTGIMDAIRYDMVEEGIRYFSSLPFRRGWEWHDERNHINVPSKSDEVLLDHLLREGILMPFSERAFQSCSRKDSYVSYEDARLKADEYERNGSRKLAVYRCPFCGRYHLTHVLHYDSSKDAGAIEEFDRRIAWYGAHSRDLLLEMGREFMRKHGSRIVRRVRDRWEREYGKENGHRREYSTRRAA